MRRTTLAAAFALLAAPLRAAVPAPAKKAPPTPVTPAFIDAQMEPLRDALADPSASSVRVQAESASFFRGLQRETPSVHAPERRMERAAITGETATIDQMLAAGRRGFDHYHMTMGSVPPPDELGASVSFSQDLRKQGREDFDKTGELSGSEMGVFSYPKKALTGGIVTINNMMAGIAGYVGRAFAFSTLVHEATHARARESGRLSPQLVIDGEMEAYRVEYEWLTVFDPRGEKTATTLWTLQERARLHPDDSINLAALRYMEHLVRLRNTRGEEGKLRAYVESLGYEDGADGKDGGIKAGSDSPRA
jgi:hypothetical protein